ncbi:MAG: hypothetical protein RLZZ450_5150, partial [Pseudomonadota bacterium]
QHEPGELVLLAEPQPRPRTGVRVYLLDEDSLVARLLHATSTAA